MRNTHTNKISFSMDLKNKAMNRAYREKSATNDNTYWLGINLTPSQQTPNWIKAPIIFNSATNGKVANASNVMFAVPSGTTIDLLELFTNEVMTNKVDGIALVGAEIKTYNTDGSYTVVDLTLEMKEAV